MSNGHPIHLSPPAGNSGSAAGAGLTRKQESPHLRGNSGHDTLPPGHLKQNSAQHFDHDWHNSQANNLKNNLLSMLFGSRQETNHFQSGQQNNQTQNSQQQQNGFSQSAQNSYSNTAQHGNSSQNTEAKSGNFLQNAGYSFRSQGNHNNQNIFSLLNNAVNYASRSLQNLIGLAREHTDFRNFQNQPENFWQNIDSMSAVRILQSQTGEIRLVSRYGELLDRFINQGGQLENFLLSLPVAEREVFAARYQMEKTFGADRFFIGNGITPDVKGNFNVRQFLANNGKAVDLPLNFVVSLRESGLLDAESHLLANNRLLLNFESAALLGASLAFYANLAATVNLKDAVIYALLQNFLISAKENTLPPQIPVNLPSDEAPTQMTEATAFKPNKSDIVGALINGTLSAVDKNSWLSDKINVGAWNGGDAAASRLGFSAGATGAMMGAAIGCLVPLSGDAAGRATGLATSIVIGTAERGLRSINLNLLISDVVTNAVQTLLDTLQGKILPAPVKAHLQSLPPVAASPIEDLRFDFLNRRMNAYLTA